MRNTKSFLISCWINFCIKLNMCLSTLKLLIEGHFGASRPFFIYKNSAVSDCLWFELRNQLRAWLLNNLKSTHCSLHVLDFCTSTVPISFSFFVKVTKGKEKFTHTHKYYGDFEPRTATSEHTKGLN